MRRVLLVFLAPLALFALGACQSQVPLASTYDLTYQQKMQAAEHWRVLARDIVAQVALRAAPYGYDIAIEREGPSTVFATAFDDMLVTEFVQSGFLVRDTVQAGGLLLRYKTQLVTHAPGRDVRPPVGTFVALGGGIIALHAALENTLSAGNINVLTAATAGALELSAGSIAEVTDTEFIVTTSLLSEDLYVARYTDIYYLPDGDADLYQVETVAAQEAPFTIVYDSWVRTLSDVRTEASARCQRGGMAAELTGREFSQRMQTAMFRCYVP
jgi:hypothetical protein